VLPNAPRSAGADESPDAGAPFVGDPEQEKVP
jgi:hypothetical protein